MPASATLALTFERFDGAYGFHDPAVPGATAIEDLIPRAAERLRFPRRDLDGKPLAYALLDADHGEVPKSKTVGEVLRDQSKVFITHEYKNAGAAG